MHVDRDKVVQAAQKWVAKGRLDRAVIEYQKLVKANPSDDRSLLKIAELQTRMRAYDAAVSTYETVAGYYASQGFSAKAMAIYKQIRGLIQQHLPDSKGHYGPVVDKLAGLYVEAGLKGDAIATYQEYVVHLLRVGRDAELLPVYRKIVELKDDDFDTRLRLIEALRAAGENDEADDNLLAYGERLVELGRIDEGLVALDNVSQRRIQDAVLARRVADLYLDRNGPGDAMIALQRMQACFLSTKRDIDTLRVLARALTTIGQRAKAIEVRKLMVKIAKDNGDLDIAQALVDELLEDCPREPGLDALVASVYPDRVRRPVPMPVDDAPEVDVGPASVDLSEQSFELIEDSVIELGDEALQAVSSFPAPPLDAPYDGLGTAQPARPYEGGGFPAAAREPRAPKTLSSYGPPPERRAPMPSTPQSDRFGPQRPLSPPRPYETRPVPPRPGPLSRPVARGPLPPLTPAPQRPPVPSVPRPVSPIPSYEFGDDVSGMSDLDADYDALVPGDDDFEEENTLARRIAAEPESLPPPDFVGADPGSLPPPDFIGDTDDPFESVARGSTLDEGEFLDDGQLAAFAIPGISVAEPLAVTPSPAEPVYEVDDALEEALEEADFFVSQGLFDDALSLLEEQIPRYPGHPLLIERMQSVRAAKGA